MAIGPQPVVSVPNQPTLPVPCSTFVVVPLVAGLGAPFLLTCVILPANGAFPAFWFWTVPYASDYASTVSFDSGVRLLRTVLGVLTGPDMPFWVLPWVAMVVIWWDKRLSIANRVLMAILLACSLGSVVIGCYFRPHISLRSSRRWLC